MNKNPIKIEAVVKAPINKVWEFWNEPEHIVKWAFASDDWEAPAATNDLRVGGRFRTTMAAKDKSSSFEFEGTYKAVVENQLIEYDMDDDRHVKTEFAQVPRGVKVVTTFDPETENSEELQKKGWQAILNNFKKYAEGNQASS